MRVRLAGLFFLVLAVAWSNGVARGRPDIDGDGHPDRVSLTSHRDGFILRVQTNNGVISTRQRIRSYEPRIVAFRPMNAQRGLEIEVLVDHGAANEFIVFYTLARRGLVKMTGGPHDPVDAPGVWDVGGTIGTGTTEADCVRRARVAVLKRWSHRGVWHYRATIYDVRATRFVEGQVFELASERRVTRLPRDWPNVRGFDFASCGGLRLSQ